jgi:hypothetical protein
MKQQTCCQQNSQTNDYEWDNAIKDAESEILDLNRKLAKLRRAVVIFKANKRDGVPLPGSAAGTDEESTPA